MSQYLLEASYFPGCTMKTSAEESSAPMHIAFQRLGVKLYELEDWNCCGSSSGHALGHDIATSLGARNLSKAPLGRPIVVPCPNCFRNMATAWHHLKEDPELLKKNEQEFGRINVTDPVLNSYDIFHHVFNLARMQSREMPETRPLTGLKVAVYYGCGAMYPKVLRPEGPPRNTIERLMMEMGADVVTWPWPHKCCSAFVSAVYPEIAEGMVSQIVSGAVEQGADCIVTSCAMCQMNVEMRSLGMTTKLPIIHL
ncbi:MAG: heterodisulfide reductase-related iron-sulfur binding cluster, partial [Candidatus Adiutrix sp.]